MQQSTEINQNTKQPSASRRSLRETLMQRQNPNLNEDLPTVMSNMVNKEKKPINEEYSPNTEMKEMHHYTRLKAGMLAP